MSDPVVVYGELYTWELVNQETLEVLGEETMTEQEASLRNDDLVLDDEPWLWVPKED